MPHYLNKARTKSWRLVTILLPEIPPYGELRLLPKVYCVRNNSSPGKTGVGGAQVPLTAIQADLQGLPSRDPSTTWTCGLLQGKKEPQRKSSSNHVIFRNPKGLN